MIQPEVVADDFAADPGLRPQVLGDFVGQDQARENLKVFIDAARGRLRLAWTGTDGRIMAVIALARQPHALPHTTALARLLDPATDRGAAAPAGLRLALLERLAASGGNEVVLERAVLGGWDPL